MRLELFFIGNLHKFRTLSIQTSIEIALKLFPFTILELRFRKLCFSTDHILNWNHVTIQECLIFEHGFLGGWKTTFLVAFSIDGLELLSHEGGAIDHSDIIGVSNINFIPMNFVIAWYLDINRWMANRIIQTLI